MSEPAAPITVQLIPEDPKAMLGRLAAGLAVTLVTGIALTYLMRKANDPDFLNITRMRGINLITRYSDNRIEFWQGVSDKAKTARLRMMP